MGRKKYIILIDYRGKMLQKEFIFMDGTPLRRTLSPLSPVEKGGWGRTADAD